MPQLLDADNSQYAQAYALATLDGQPKHGAVTLAVADACPLSPRLTLPRHYLQTMTELQALHLPGLEQRRKIPEWGAQIFSPLAVVFTPSGADELAGFVKYAIALTHAHLLVSRCCFS